MKAERFTLTPQHIALLRSANVGWNPAEDGAPTIDPKRPYGSDVARDVARILGVPGPDPDASGDEDWFESTGERMRAIHRETETALRIILYTGSFEPGVYERLSSYGREWRLVE